MAQQVVDLKPGGDDLANADTVVLSSAEKQSQVAVKKTPLRDLRSENNILPCTSTGNSTIQKEVTPAIDGNKVSGTGTKRPSTDSTMSSPQHQSPGNNGANGHLVYVRRKSEEVGKTNTDETTGSKSEITVSKAGCTQQQKPQPASLQMEMARQHPQINDSKMPCASAFAPISTASVMSFPSGIPSVPPLLKSSRTVAAESRAHPVSADQRKMMRNWEERYAHLQMYLKMIDQSSQEDYVLYLRALSSSELSSHAVELEKRAIQLSLEEGKELQRVKALSVLGKSLKSPLSVQHHLPQK